MDSTWIANSTRDDSTGNVTLETKNGSSYEVQGMSADTFEDWHNSESAGSYFNANIRGQYEITKR